MRTITLNGKEFKLAMNMATAITYQRLTGLDAFQIMQNFHEGSRTILDSTINIGYSMLLAKNDPIDVPDFDVFTKIDDVMFTSEFIKAVIAELMDYFKLTPHEQEVAKAAAESASKQGEKKEEGEKKEDDPKNA